MKIADAFGKRKAFIAFVTCGDPDLSVTAKIIIDMAKSGVDLIELGIPFSDPTAEGPVIQKADMNALAAGVTTDSVFEMADRIKGEVGVPLAVMTYANVVFSYGIGRFARKAKACGICGIILPDVPFEEKEEFAPVFEKYGIDFISLVAPTSRDRTEMVAKDARGFVYCVSSLGVTGMRDSIGVNVESMVRAVKSATDIPAAVGFGISTPEQAAAIAKQADGVIIGSAIVRLISEQKDKAPEAVHEFVTAVRKAMDAQS